MGNKKLIRRFGVSTTLEHTTLDSHLGPDPGPEKGDTGFGEERHNVSGNEVSEHFFQRKKTNEKDLIESKQ